MTHRADLEQISATVTAHKEWAEELARRHVSEEIVVCWPDGRKEIVYATPRWTQPLSGIPVWFLAVDTASKNSAVVLKSAEAGVKFPEHTHDQNERITVLEGSIVMTVNGETFTLLEDESYVIPAYVPHSIFFVTDSVLLLKYIPRRMVVARLNTE